MSKEIKKKELIVLEKILASLNLPVKTEYKFSSIRDFRFDYFIQIANKGIAIEYEGLSFNLQKKLAGHQTAEGFIENCTKYNLALSMGIPVLRYTCFHLKYPANVKREIELTINQFFK